MLSASVPGLLALSLLAAPDPDPRIPLAESAMVGEPAVTLAAAERLLATRPELARSLGLDYLRGRLLDRLDRREEAADAFLVALSTAPDLSLYSYFWLARDYERLGHPETAAGLIAHVVAAAGSFPEIAEATRLLRRSIAAGGDCRLLVGIDATRLPDAQRREVELTRAECALGRGDPKRGEDLLETLLEERRDDEPALAAADLLAGRLGGNPVDRSRARLVGLTLHEHRDFARSSQFLDLALRPPSRRSRTLKEREFGDHYARVRNDFWLGDYAAAAAGFARLAGWAPEAELEADALYQRGRSLELLGDWPGAVSSFLAARTADPGDSWGAAGLLAALRLLWRSGREEQALELYGQLQQTRRGRPYLARAALFLAASELVRGRTERVAGWLEQAERTRAVAAPELAYWRGRLAELGPAPATAVGHYLEVLRADPHHPFAQAARARLTGERLAAAATALGVRLAASGRPRDLLSAWLLLGEEHRRGLLSLTSLKVRLGDDPRAAPFLALRRVPVDQWALWEAEILRPEERLLALGLWEEGAPAVGRHFPLSDPSLAFTGGHILWRAGQFQGALRVAEILAQRLPDSLPERLLQPDYRRLLYPLPYREILQTAAKAEGIDPYLLAAIIREESRFDPRALSSASARGLTQMTRPTAGRLADALGMEDLTEEDLYRPEVSIRLGAAHLAELQRRLQGVDAAVVAAYNAGEHQAQLWVSHCFSEEPAEYLSKVGFRQTRAYVQKVLASRSHYREIYGGPPSKVSTTGGSSPSLPRPE